MKKLVITAAMALTFAFGTVAFAQPSTGITNPAKAAASDCARAKKLGKPCKVSFDKGDTLTGTNPTGDGEDVSVAGERLFGNLIKVRMNFNDKMIKTAEDLI